MPYLGEFEVVGELTEETLNEILKSAWDNDIVPHSVQIPAGTSFGPYALKEGVVNIHREDISLEMDVPANGVRITLGSEIQVEIDNPPVPSVTMFDMTADILASVPIGVLPGTIHVAAMLNSIPRSAVSATLTSGDPVPALTDSLIAEYVHARYEDNTIPHTQTETGISFGTWTTDAFLEIFDDASDASRQIEVSQPDANHVEVRLPFHLRLSNITASFGPAPFSPMGITGRISITAALTLGTGSLTVQFSTATVAIEDIAAADGQEGTNYTLNKAGASALGIDLDALFVAAMQTRAQSIVTALGDQTFSLPTVSQIETFIADQAHAAIIGRGDIALWTPNPPPGSEVTVTDVRPLALSDAIAFCLNNPAGNTAAITNFIPASRTCAIAIDGDTVIQMIWDQINKPESEGGFGGIPHTEHNVNGHDAVVNSLSVSLETGHILIEGDVTVIDAIGCVDVDATFSAEVGLEWEDNADGTQTLKPYVIGEPDVDLSLLAWILSFLLSFITGGLVGGIIALVILAVAEGVAEKIGGTIIRDEITGQVRGIGAWPQTLDGIGDVIARFENPVEIDPHSVIFPDPYMVVAQFASTVIAFAEANGPYVVDAGAPVTFVGGPDTVDTTYEWDFGDGATASGRTATHTYADDGIYVAKLTTTVNQPGGVVTRQFARVHARNVPPVVDAGADLTIDEGQVVKFTASFTDQEWPDTHKATFDFGDDSLPVEGEVTETNQAPKAEGTVSAEHAYCDNGEYTVTVKVMDDDGGVGIDKRTATVRNVPPTVDAGSDRFAYPGIPISLDACFTDPGWCDTHVATWEFGDCTPVTPAVVRETNDPPQAVGVAAAIHIYQHCGTYLAICTVTDDDGGVGRDDVHVRVVSLKNAGFENGFRQRLVGQVANDWHPYGGQAGTLLHTTHAAALPAEGQSARQNFMAEEFIVHGGQRSQHIAGAGRFRAGIHQSIGANRDWDYQVSAWYHLDERGVGICRLGVDPYGGTNPEADTVVWTQGDEQKDWAGLLVRVTAVGRRITIFLEVQNLEEGDERKVASGYFDDVLLIPYPCPVTDCQPEEEPPQEQRLCVDWKDERKPTRLGYDYQKKGFTFKSRGNMPLLTAIWGDPPGQCKLQFPADGVEVGLPFEANRVTAKVVSGTTKPIYMEAFDEAGNSVGQTSSPSAPSAIALLEIKAEGITSLLISDGGNEGLLIELCAFQETGEAKEESSKKKVRKKKGCC